MINGTKHTTKAALLSAVERIKKNFNFESTSDKIQESDKDIIESLWDRGGCEVVEFTQSSLSMTATIKRIVCSDDSVTINITLTALDENPTQVSQILTFNDILPLNFNGKMWFKVQSLISVIDSSSNNFGLGCIVLNDLSSYNNGIPTGNDLTSIFLMGNVKGRMRVFDWDTDSNFSSALAWNNLDNNTNALSGSSLDYPENSPKDLTISPLNIVLKNKAAYFGLPFQNSQGVVKISITGKLL